MAECEINCGCALFSLALRRHLPTVTSSPIETHSVELDRDKTRATNQPVGSIRRRCLMDVLCQVYRVQMDSALQSAQAEHLNFET